VDIFVGRMLVTGKIGRVRAKSVALVYDDPGERVLLM